MQMISGELWEISKNTYFEEHLRTAALEVTLGRDCLGLFLWRVAFKTILPDLVILQKYQSFSNQSLTHNSAHMPSLDLTPMLFLNLGLLCASLTFTTEKANACSHWTSCLKV